MGKFGESEDAKAKVISSAKGVGDFLGINERKWRCETYGPLGWMEDIVKGLAILIGILSVTQYESDSLEYLPYSGWTIAIMVIMGILLLFHCSLVIQRFAEKEIHAILFIFAAIIGHLILFIILFVSIDPGAFVFTFSFLWIIGEYIKIMFLFVNDSFQPLWLKKPILYVMAIVVIGLHIVILVCQALRWSTEYED